MKKLFCFFLCIILFVPLIGCNSKFEKSIHQISVPTFPNESNSIAATNIEKLPIEDSLKWYEKIRFVGDGSWSSSIIETNRYFYYATESGLYRYEKSTENDVKIYYDRVLGLYLQNESLYFSTKDTIKCYDLNKETVETVWDRTMLPEDSYFYGIEFKIIDNNMYIAPTGTSVIVFNLETKVSKQFLDDFSSMVVSANNCYYVDHAQRTWSIYHMDVDTLETKLLRGKGISEPSIDDLRYDELIKFGNDVYYNERSSKGIYRLNTEGDDDHLLFTYEGIDVQFRKAPLDGIMYFRFSDEKNTYIYQYDGTEVKQLISFEDNKKIVDYAVTESAIFWSETVAENEKKTYMESL